MAIREAGGRTLGQDAATSIVYGMPKAAQDAGAVEQQGSPERLAEYVLRLCAREQLEAR
jgi:two-component system chemotaxis response regulator CheB